jgi:ribosomal protein L7/L12
MSESLDALLIKLHEEWKPIEAIKAIKTELDVSLSEAKQYLHDHPAWRADLEKWDKVLDEVELEVRADGHL